MKSTVYRGIVNPSRDCRIVALGYLTISRSNRLALRGGWHRQTEMKRHEGFGASGIVR